MPVSYTLLNHTKKQMIDFSGIGVSSKREISGHLVASTLITWYLFDCSRDNIEFVSEHDWKNEYNQYTEITNHLIDELIEAQILTQYEPYYIVDDDGDILYRNVKNTWES